MTDTPKQVVIDALEAAGFKGTWEYGGDTALTSAIDTAEIVVAALTEAGYLT